MEAAADVLGLLWTGSLTCVVGGGKGLCAFLLSCFLRYSQWACCIDGLKGLLIDAMRLMVYGDAVLVAVFQTLMAVVVITQSHCKNCCCLLHSVPAARLIDCSVMRRALFETARPR